MTDATGRNLAEWLDYVSAVHPVGWDLGLDRVMSVGQELDVLKPAPVTVLVAGTNGKGSTCAYLSAFARANGRRVGVSTSPHLRRFNERIVIDGEEVDDARICAAFQAIEDARGTTTLTYFEFASLASMVIFRDEAVDVAILEVGLGGRLDAMNIVTPDLSIITSIDLDHQDWLGDTREDIGREKAGIMRGQVRCIIADPDPPASLLEHASRIGAPFDLIGRDYHLPDLPTRLPAASFAAARQAACVLGWDDAGADRIASETGLEGRGSVRRDGCEFLLDVAHNPAAARYLAGLLEARSPRGSIHALVGMYRDKDIEAVTGCLAPVFKTWHLTPLDDPRGASTDELRPRLVAPDDGAVSVYGNIAQAVAGVRDIAGEDDLVVVFGSFPVVAGALEQLDQSHPR